MSRAFACAHSGGPCHRRSSIVGRPRGGTQRRTCVRMLVARWRSCLRSASALSRSARAAAPATWWAADTRAPLCGPLVASRPPADQQKNATNPHHIALGSPPSTAKAPWGRVSAGFQEPALESRPTKRFYPGPTAAPALSPSVARHSARFSLMPTPQLFHQSPAPTPPRRTPPLPTANNGNRALRRMAGLASGLVGFPFFFVGFLGAGGRLPKARRGRVFVAKYYYQYCYYYCYYY